MIASERFLFCTDMFELHEMCQGSLVITFTVQGDVAGLKDELRRARIYCDCPCHEKDKCVTAKSAA